MDESVIIRTDEVERQMQEQNQSTDQTTMDLLQDDTTVRMDSFISASAAGMDSKLNSFVLANQQSKFQLGVKDISPLGAPGDHSGFLSGQSIKQELSHPSQRKKSYDSSALKLALRPANPEAQGGDSFASAFVPTGDGTQIEGGPDAVASLITPRFQGPADAQKWLAAKEGDASLRDASGKACIGIQELSFIRKEGSLLPGNSSGFFIDSFLQDRVDETILKNLDPHGQFKDVEA